MLVAGALNEKFKAPIFMDASYYLMAYTHTPATESAERMPPQRTLVFVPCHRQLSEKRVEEIKNTY